MCIKCRHQLPLTGFVHLNDNNTEKIFFGRVKIENAASFIWFHKKSITQRLIHDLKYKGNQKAGRFIGRWMGAEMLKSDRFKEIDMVIPVPLSKRKLRNRGYNQVSEFARALSEMLSCEYKEDILSRNDSSTSQTFKSRQIRNFGSAPVFTLNSDLYLSGKHILVADDVITTGATLENCIKQFSHIPNLRVSIVSIALTA
ncbi:ComF family protein [Robertkochia solimangrovi]|uniref:ComF family protein n=1 Tax=Robertkochia solimangrovi TaxID=2213046 RepID=UPI00117D3761|nr:ComF family protein [Robertkochia solimangrovi]